MKILLSTLSIQHSALRHRIYDDSYHRKSAALSQLFTLGIGNKVIAFGERSRPKPEYEGEAGEAYTVEY